MNKIQAKRWAMKEFWNSALEEGIVKAKPRSGKCILCGIQLEDYDLDHSVCNKCWPKEEEDDSNDIDRKEN